MGLDCGGSACRVLTVDEAGSVLHMGQAGPANLASTPPARLVANLAKATAGSPTPDRVAACFAGLLTPNDRERALGILTGMFPRSEVIAEPDYVAVLAAGGPDIDVAILSGTGSLVCSMTPEGPVKSGGGGYLLGDFGSEFQYGRAALRHFLDAGESGCSTNLTQSIQRVFGSLEENQVLANLYRGGSPAAKLAKLAPSFAKDALAGEAYALETLNLENARLAEVVRTHVERWLSDRNPLRVALAGGLWEGQAIFRQRFEAELRTALPSIDLLIAKLPRPPVHGAVVLARRTHS